MNVRTMAVAALVIGMVSLGAAAQAPSEPVALKVGDPAPPLLIEKWVKGQPVEKFQKDHVYVMEFWATWCGPCVAAMPHVSELQKKYEGKVTVLGVNIWERERDKVEPFVQKMGDKMAYTVAMEQVGDGGPNDGKMSQTWMRAAGRNGIPCSFIVDRQGKIAWIGHPMTMDRPLKAIVEGKFDPAAEAARQKQEEQAQQELSAAFRAKEWDKAIALIDKLSADNESAAAMYQPAKLQVLMQKGDYAAVNALAAKMTQGGDRRSLQSVVQVMASAPDPKKLDTDLMLKSAKRLAETAEADDWVSGYLLARVHAARGEYDKAAEVQRGVVQKADERMKASQEKLLKEYEAKAGNTRGQ